MSSVGSLVVEDAVARVRSRLEVFTDTDELLRRLREDGGLGQVRRAEIGLVMDAMHHGAVQTYWGGWGGETLWQGVHPLLDRWRAGGWSG
jgi:hypothetical protein